MGQYWLPVNLDKREFFNPHQVGAGLKLVEQVGSMVGDALVILCAAQPHARGGGDLGNDHGIRAVVGRWAGDRIALVGDYAEDTDLPLEFHASTIYKQCNQGKYEDISAIVAAALEKINNVQFKGTGWRDVVEVDGR